MEKTYPPTLFYTATDNLCFKDYFRQYADTCKLRKSMPKDEKLTEDYQKRINKTVLNIMGKKLSTKERNELAEMCSFRQLDVEGETGQVDNSSKSISGIQINDPIVTANKNKLATVRCKEQYQQYISYVTQVQLRNRFGAHLESKGISGTEQDLQPGSDIVVSVQIYRPITVPLIKNDQNAKLRFSHEIIVLGSNTLTELRDKILCGNDAGLCVEVSSPNTTILFGEAKKTYPSGFIFIDNVFYNDMREKNSIDYSEVICKWAKGKDIGELKATSMENVRIDELSPRLGYPYVYQHQGNCEHILVFSDVCLLTEAFSLLSKSYPFVNTVKRHISKVCNICGTTSARWMCVGSDRLPHEKTFLCHECFSSYNFVSDKKVGKFKAFPYFDIASLM